MHVVMAIVGVRPDPWIDLCATLSKRIDIELTLLVTNAGPRALHDLNRLSRAYPHVHVVAAPTLLGEFTPHYPAATWIGPGAGRRLKQLRPHVLHIIGDPAGPSTYQIIKRHKKYWPHIPITWYAAQNVAYDLPFPFNRLESHTYRSINHAFPLTPAAEDVLRARGFRGDCTIVPLGVDTDLFTPSRQRREAPPQVQPGSGTRSFTVGYIGWLEPHKGIRSLLKAVDTLDCRLIVLGKGSLYELVEARASRSPGRILLFDKASRHRLPELFAQMDALVLPSCETRVRGVAPWVKVPAREPFPRVLLEAMACGVPVVGSDVGEIPYLVADAGLIFPAGDTKALTNRLAEIRDDHALARRLSAAGRARAETFALSRVADTMCRTWRALVDSWQPVGIATQRVFRGVEAPASTPAPLPRPPEVARSGNEITTQSARAGTDAELAGRDVTTADGGGGQGT